MDPAPPGRTGGRVRAGAGAATADAAGVRAQRRVLPPRAGAPRRQLLQAGAPSAGAVRGSGRADVRPVPHRGRDVHVAAPLGGAVPGAGGAVRGRPQLREPADPAGHADEPVHWPEGGQAGGVFRGRPPQRRGHVIGIGDVAGAAPPRGLRPRSPHHAPAGHEGHHAAAAEQPGRLELLPAHGHGEPQQHAARGQRWRRPVRRG
jgi:hypothetical protein